MAFNVFDDANQGNSFIVTIVALPICLLIITLRLIIRRRTIGWEDYFAVFATLNFLVYCGCNLWILTTTNGKSPFQLGELPQETVIKIYKAGYVMNPQTVMNQTFAKLSLLILYYRIFEVAAYFRYEVFVVGSAQIAWGIANVLVRLFFCQPIKATFNPFIKGKCMDPNMLMLVGEGINGLIDFIMVAMALQIVHKLQLPRIERLKMSVLFAIGGFCGVIEIIKISITYGRVGNSNLNATWNVAQMATTLICCCFPIYKPLFRHMHKFTQRASNYISSKGRGETFFSGGDSTHKDQLTERSKNSQDNEDDWLRLDERAGSV